MTEPCLTGPSGDAASTGLYLPTLSGVGEAFQPLGETLDQGYDSSLKFVSGAVSEGVDVASGAVKYGLKTATAGVDTAGNVVKGVSAAFFSLLQALGIVSVLVILFVVYAYRQGHINEYISIIARALPMKPKKSRGAAAICGTCM